MGVRGSGLRVLVVGAVVAETVLVGAESASATNYVTPNCGSPGLYGGHCIWWDQNYTGAHVYSYADASDDFNQVSYPNNGTGSGSTVGNNNGSDDNRSTAYCRTLYYNPNQGSGPTIQLGKYGSTVLAWRRSGSALGTLLNNIRSDSDYPVCSG